MQHDGSEVLLFPLKPIVMRVEFLAVNFIVVFFFSNKSYSFFSLPCSFLGGFSFCYLINRENILLFSLASYVRSMF